MLDWLVDIRKTKNKTQEEVSINCGIARAYYSMIETGERTPSVDTAKKIARELGFDWAKFFEGEEV